VFGCHLTVSGRTSFLFGIAVGAVTSLGLHRLLTDLRPPASRAADAGRATARNHREKAFINQDDSLSL
jgi:hypothetical protein